MAISLNPSQLLLNNDKHKTRNTSPTTHRKATVRSILPNKMAKRRRRSTSARANRWVNIFVLIVSALFFVASVLTRGTSLDTFSILPDFKLAHFPVSPADAALVQRASRNDQPLENTPALHGFSVPDDTQTSRRDLDRRGVEEHLTTVRQDWRGVVTSFLESATVSDFAAKGIREHYVANQNNVQETCMLVRILNGNVSFTENYTSKRHGRALSVKYMLNKIVREKGDSMPGATFLVMVTDGHKPRVATFGSARHWKNWKLMIPVPLGNERGQRDGWGTPLEGWDKYVERTVLSTHRNYSWESKTEKAVFRGSLSMQTYKLGSCNEENGPKCIRASRWTEVNRGVLYEKTKSRQDLVDIGFTSLKQKADGDPGQFEGAPQLAKPMKFQDYQKYKYVLNVGSNQDWAERLRSLLFLNSAVIHHTAESQEFFTPLLKPWVHFIPTSLYFEDLVKNIEWAKENDDFVRQLVRNQNAFADRYISEKSMQQYWEVAIEEFSALQAQAASLA